MKSFEFAVCIRITQEGVDANDAWNRAEYNLNMIKGKQFRQNPDCPPAYVSKDPVVLMAKEIV